jgi:hypothetical protein
MNADSRKRLRQQPPCASRHFGATTTNAIVLAALTHIGEVRYTKRLQLASWMWPPTEGCSKISAKTVKPCRAPGRLAQFMCRAFPERRLAQPEIFDRSTHARDSVGKFSTGKVTEPTVVLITRGPANPCSKRKPLWAPCRLTAIYGVFQNETEDPK